jgi:uncharacterized membrane protein YebE (DUF533 family)
MNLKSLKKMDKDEILTSLLGSVGLQTKESDGARVASALGTFGVGLLVGAGLALLLAPKPGRELRQDLRARVSRGTGEADLDDLDPSARGA